MGRKQSPGINFYRMNSGHVGNKKVRLLRNKHDSDGYFIWSALIDHAYQHHGYFFNMNDESEFILFSDDIHKPMELIKEVIECCIQVGLFNRAIAGTYGVLTSEMMQDNFIIATAERRKKGGIFEMQKLWLCISFDDFPLNIKILPGHGSILPGKNPQKREEENRREIEESLGERSPTPISIEKIISENTNGKKKSTGGGKFIAPTKDEVIGYIVEKKSRPGGPHAWFEDRCRLEAAKFYSHYKTRGWQLGGGMKMVDWMAGVDSWLLKDLDIPTIGQRTTATPAHAIAREKRELNQTDKEINFLYERFLDDPDVITINAIEVGYYERLKDIGIISFDDQQRTVIRSLAESELLKRQLPSSDQMINGYMKKIAVIEFFKQCKETHKPEIFTL